MSIVRGVTSGPVLIPLAESLFHRKNIIKEQYLNCEVIVILGGLNASDYISIF